MSELYLIHHGIKGQKWGITNGPPYPLNFDRLSPEERAQAKHESIMKGDITTAKANSKHYTTKELDDLINRYNKLKTISDVQSKENRDTYKRGHDNVIQVLNDFSTFADFIGAGVRIYNNIADINNTFGISGSVMRPIGGKKRKS